jgi:hypothetical protein
LTQLGPEAQKLILAGKQALKPSLEDRERLRAALQATLPPNVIDNPLQTPETEQVGSSGVTPAVGRLGVSGLVVGLGIALGGYWWAQRSVPNSALLATSSETVASAFGSSSVFTPDAAEAARAEKQPAVAVTSLVAVATPPATTQASTRNPSPADKTPSAESLAQEVALLSRAEKEFHAGNAANALSLLSEHRRTFPKGVLVQERVALRVHVLCKLGRVAEAEADLRRLGRLSKGSPLESSARAACNGASK